MPSTLACFTKTPVRLSFVGQISQLLPAQPLLISDYLIPRSTFSMYSLLCFILYSFRANLVFSFMSSHLSLSFKVSICYRQSNHHCPIATHHFLHTVALCLVLCNLGQPSCFSLQTSLYITQIRISDCFIVLFPVAHSNSFLDAVHKVQFWTLRLR